MKRAVGIVFVMMLILLTACIQEQVAKPEIESPRELSLSELNGHYEIEDYTDFGLWVLTVEAEVLKGKLSESDEYHLTVEDVVYEVRWNPLNTRQLMAFLPGRLDMEYISRAKIAEGKMKQTVDREDSGDIFIESVYLTKAGTVYELTLTDYLFMKQAPDAFVYEDGKLLRPTHVKSSDGYAYLMKYYYDARQASTTHDVNGAFGFLKGLQNHNDYIYTGNPYRVKIEDGHPVTDDPDHRDRVWQLGVMGLIDEAATCTYDITDDRVAQKLTLTIKADNLPVKYQQSGIYEIQLKGDATVCFFNNRSGTLYDCVIDYATTSNIDLVKNARFTEMINSTQTDIRVKSGNEPHARLITDDATVLKVASGTTVAQMKTYLEAVDGSEQTYSFRTAQGELTDASTFTLNGTLTVFSPFGEPYSAEYELRVNANPFVRLESVTNPSGVRIMSQTSWHDSVQSAIEAGTDGSTITLWPGEYKEALKLSENNNDYHIMSINPTDGDTRDKTVINANGILYSGGPGYSPVLMLAGGQTADTVIEGLTLTTRMAMGSMGSPAVYIVNSTPEIRSCRITENSGSSYGGGVFISIDGAVNPSEDPYLHHNLIEKNYAYTGGGIYVDQDSRAKIVENEIRDNMALANGGGISVYGGGIVRNVVNVTWKPNLLPGTAADAAAVEGTQTTNTFSGNTIKDRPNSDAADIFFEPTDLFDGEVVVHGGEKWARVYKTLVDGSIVRLFTDAEALTEVASAVYTAQPMQSRLSNTYVQIDYDQIQTGTTYYVTLQSTPTLYAQSTKIATEAVAGPAVTTLSSPTDALTDVVLSPLLEWNSAERAEIYTVYLGRVSGNLTKTAEGLTATEYATAALDASTTYYWQVESVDLYGATALSAEWSFTTTDVPAVSEDGSAEHPFLIDSIEELAKVGSGTDGWDLDKYYKLNRNLDFNEEASYEDPDTYKSLYTTGSGWDPIGSEDGTYNGTYFFKGVFDGAGYTIKNLMINRTSTNGGVGLFGVIGIIDATGETTKVMNLKIEGVNITSTSDNVGALIGYSYKAEVTNCSAANVNISGASYIGALIGQACEWINDNLITIEYCWASGIIKATASNNGGLVGSIYNTKVKGCYADVSIQLYGTNCNTFSSPFIADANAGSVIQDCYSLGDCAGNHYDYGGILGAAYNTSVSNTYATGDLNISNTDNVVNVAGLIGLLEAESSLFDSVAFNSQITAGDYYNDEVGTSTTNRVVGKLVEGGTISGCYANPSMVVKWEGEDETFNKGTTTVDGADIANLTSTGTAPMTSWDFDTDTNGDHIYWKLETGANRPVLYVDPEGDGSFVKLGTDDGL
ncbi:MAG TPA: hypothetical protein PLB99_13705 [Thermotogota bacterium]|nr:hypothetical protein [Thermotogota bacterium]